MPSTAHVGPARQYDADFDGAPGSHFVMGLVFGAMAGATLGLLFAPKAGYLLRRDLRSSAEDIQRRAGRAYDDAADTVNDVVDAGRDLYDRASNAGRDLYDRASNAGRDVYDRASNEAADVAAKAKARVDQGMA